MGRRAIIFEADRDFNLEEERYEEKKEGCNAQSCVVKLVSEAHVVHRFNVHAHHAQSTP